jgi:hypothetical protein
VTAVFQKSDAVAGAGAAGFGRRYFRCRQCYGLVYASTREPLHQRAIDRADRLRKCVVGVRGAFDGEDFPPKPPRTRWRTYWRLERQYEELQVRWLAGFTAGTAQLLERLRRSTSAASGPGPWGEGRQLD